MTPALDACLNRACFRGQQPRPHPAIGIVPAGYEYVAHLQQISGRSVSHARLLRPAHVKG